MVVVVRGVVGVGGVGCRVGVCGVLCIVTAVMSLGV